MRKVTFPELAAQTCERCTGTGHLPPEMALPLTCTQCGTVNRPEITPCQSCAASGQIEPPTPEQILGQTLQPTKEERDTGGGVGMEEMAANYPIAQALRDHENREMYLTDEQWRHLMARLNITKWVVWNEDIWLICQAVKEAEDVDAAAITHLNRSQRRELAKS